MTHPTPHPDARSPIDSFTDWLDAGGPGKAPPDSVDVPEPDADLADICQAARQLHDLDVGFQQYAAAISSRSRLNRWEDTMQTQPALSPSASVPSIQPTSRTSHDRPRSPRWLARPWQVAINAALAAILILGLGVGIWRQFGPSTPLPWQDGSPGNPNGLISNGTPAADVAADCTITPLTREQIKAHYAAANIATTPENVRYDHPLKPTPEEAMDIQETFGLWQACRGDGADNPSKLALQTPWFTAHTSPWLEFDRPVSDETLAFLVDFAFAHASERDAVMAQYHESFPRGGGTPLPEAYMAPTYVPIPHGATPYAEIDAYPSLMPSDLRIIGPDRAEVSVYNLNFATGSSERTPFTVELVMVDGHWLINELTINTPVEG